MAALLNPAASDNVAQHTTDDTTMLGVERMLATARVLLAAVSLIAIYIDPTEPTRYAALAYGLLIVYVVYSLTVWLFVRLPATRLSRLSFWFHSVDAVWATAIVLLTEGPNSPFFVFFIFLQLSAAHRWGMKETFQTTILVTGLLAGEALILSLKYFGLEGEFEWNRLIIRFVYLQLVAFLVGYLSEREKAHRDEALLVSSILRQIQSERSFPKALYVLMSEFHRLTGGRRLILALQERAAGNIFTWDASPSRDGRLAMRLHEVGASAAEAYFFDAPENCSVLSLDDSKPRTVLLSPEGNSVRQPNWRLPAGSSAALEDASFIMMICDVQDWFARLFVLHPRLYARRMATLHLLQNLLNNIRYPLYNAYLIHRERSQFGAMERSRLARELHDTIIQSLAGVGLRLEVFRRKKIMALDQEQFKAIQRELQTEINNLRELMEHLRPVELNPHELTSYLANAVDRFGRNCGVNARFVCDTDEVPLSAKTCREVVRIVQEALTNIQKHSGAQNVLVQLHSGTDQSRPGSCNLVIKDDGCGFDFSGRLAIADLDATQRGPLTIKERVRLIGGNLYLESSPGNGSCLEITVPRRS